MSDNVVSSGYHENLLYSGIGSASYDHGPCSQTYFYSILAIRINIL